MSDNETIVPKGETRYPKSGAILLLSKLNETNGANALLWDELRQRNQELTALGATVKDRPGGADYLLSKLSEETGLSAMLVTELVEADQKLAELRAQKASA